jgi:chromosome segregation protein
VYLRRLEVHGFKAFADRQRFEFGPGLTVIAGPNGSGKSNVADAIRWALGEQSAKQIRARKTEDVIFSGSDKRRQMGLAEVTLYLDNSEGWMPIEYSEVAVTRRAHRSGDNEYLINNSSVRLTDVLDLFRRAQVGQNSYAHMSQGLVDEVLALRPGERRELVEEAADLRRHRHQLTLSERRLVETRDNLGHVRMLIREVEPRIRQLQRQSKRAARYQELAGELSEALQVYFEAELRAAREAQTAGRSQHDQATRAFQEAQTESKRIENRLRDLRAQLQERRGTLEGLQGRERELAEEGLRLEQAVALAEQRLELLAERRTEVERALASMTLPDENDETAIDTLLAEYEQRIVAAQSELDRERAALTSADEATRAVLRDLSEAETRRARLEATAQDLARRIREHQQQLERRAQEREQARTQHADLTRQARQLETQLQAHEQGARQYVDAAAAARERREAAERRLEDEQRTFQEAEQALREAEALVAQLDERQRLIELLRESVPAGDAGTGALLEAAKAPRDRDDSLEGIIDAVARLIQVPDGLETAIEAALAEHMTAVVVERYEDAIAAVQYLRDHEAGTATVYPLDGLEHRYPLNLFNERGVIGIAARLVRCEQRYRPLVDTLLGRVIVVDNLAVGEQMITRGLGSVVTKDGILLRPGGVVYGGMRGGGAEQFALQRELDELPQQIESARAAIAPAQQRVERHRDVVADAREAIAAARRAVDETEERRRQHDGQRAALERKQAELTSELRSTERLMADDPAEDTTTVELEQQQEAARTELATIGERIEALRDRSEAVGKERDAVAERVSAATQALAALEADRRALAAQRDERVAARKSAIEEQRRQTEQLEALRREQEDLQLTLRDRRERQANNRTERAEAQAAVGPAHALVAELAQEESELSAARGDAQQVLHASERDLLESEHRVRQQAERVQQLLHEITEEGMEIRDDGSVHPLPKPVAEAFEDADDGDADLDDDDESTGEVIRISALAGGADVDVEALRTRIAELRAEIKSLGPVNIDALEDLTAEHDRYEFLVAQVADLEGAEAELREAIRELRKLIRTRFVETFHVVNERFGDYFQRFFGGGQAELRLIEPDEGDEDAEPGVDIFAQPPGKRISNMSVLSGGERSMTSVALLFALLSVNPAPVVVLDEVDAALDEANVGRFVDTLLELRERSQFVVISHNRRTIEAADAIYGVSMGDDSTSQVLSLKLAELPQAS